MGRNEEVQLAIVALRHAQSIWYDRRILRSRVITAHVMDLAKHAIPIQLPRMAIVLDTKLQR